MIVCYLYASLNSTHRADRLTNESKPVYDFQSGAPPLPPDMEDAGLLCRCEVSVVCARYRGVPACVEHTCKTALLVALGQTK